MSSYYQHNARKGNPKEVALDVVEFEPVHTHDGIEVHEHTEHTGEFRKLFAELSGKRV